MRLISCHISKTLYFSEAALYKVSIAPPVANRHRDFTENLLKATLTKTKKKKNKQKNLKARRTCMQKRWTYQIPFNSAKTSEKKLTAVHAFVVWEIYVMRTRALLYMYIGLWPQYGKNSVHTVTYNICLLLLLLFLLSLQ